MLLVLAVRQLSRQDSKLRALLVILTLRERPLLQAHLPLIIAVLHVILIVGGNRSIVDGQFLAEVARQSILHLVVVLHDDIEGVKLRGCATLFSLDKRVVEHVVGEVLLVVHDVVAALVRASILLRVVPAAAQLELFFEIGEAVGSIIALWPLILIILVGHWIIIKVSAAHSSLIVVRWPLVAIRCMSLILFLLKLLLLLLLGQSKTGAVYLLRVGCRSPAL